MVLFLDIGLGIPDIPDVDDLVRLNFARVQGCGSLRKRLIGAGNRLRAVRLVFEQRAAGAQIILVILGFGVVPDVPDPDGLLIRQLAAFEQREDLVNGVIRVDVIALVRQIIRAEDHVLRRDRDRLAVLRTQQVVGREHQDAGLCLRLGGQRNVNGHLVAVKVRVERGAAQRMELERAALNQNRLERLNAEAVQRRGTVEHDRTVLDDVFQSIPDLILALVDHLLGGLDVVGKTVLDELLHDERAEQLDGHFLRHAALIKLELRADDDNGTAGIVDALAEQVLTEAALLALEHIAEGLERTVIGARDGSSAAAVVDQSVDGLLQHTLFVADDDVRRLQLDEPLQAVIAVDDAAVEVIQVGGREAAAVQLDHRAQLRRNDRQHVHDHPRRIVAGHPERLDDLKALDDA